MLIKETITLYFAKYIKYPVPKSKFEQRASENKHS